jgi:hypothetical protein
MDQCGENFGDRKSDDETKCDEIAATIAGRRRSGQDGHQTFLLTRQAKLSIDCTLDKMPAHPVQN